MAREEDRRVFMLTTEVAIRLALLAVLVFACLQIFWSFALPVIWGIIIAIAVWPVFLGLRRMLGDRQKTAAVVFTLLALALLLVPSWLLAESLFDGLVAAGRELADGTAPLPPPPDDLADWPLIGEKLDRVWKQSIADPPAAIHHFRKPLANAGRALLSLVGGVGIGILQFAFSIILAGVFLATSTGGTHAAASFAKRIAGEERGQQLVETAGQTVASVVKGVLGVAVVQGVAATVGMMLVGVPGAAAWGLLVLFLAVCQLPPLLVLLPMIFYVFSTASGFGATVFMVWAFVVSVSDTFLKPLFLGRGVDVPMLVILIGAIGGMIAWGILGLFVGAVVFAVGYQLFLLWFANPEYTPGPAEASG